MTRKESDVLFTQLCATIRTTKNILKYHYNVTDEEIDNITSLLMTYCTHEWHADQDNGRNFCIKCPATQEIYTK